MPIDNEGARAAAAAAAEARRRAEEAREREERAATAAKAAAEKAAKEAAAKASRGLSKKDELSSGRGGALRRDAASKLGVDGLPKPAPSAPEGAKTFKATELLASAKLRGDGASAPLSKGVRPLSGDDRVEANRARLERQLADFQTPARNNVVAGTKAQGPDDANPEASRAARDAQAVLDAATRGLSPDKAKQVKAAASAVANAGNGISDPNKRARATAEAIKQQAAQFKGDPVSAGAFASAIAPQVEGIGRDLSNKIVPVTHDDPETGPTLKALANAADLLGPGAGLKLGQSLSNGVPDTKDLNHFDDALKNEAEQSDGGKALLFGAAKGFEAQGKTLSRKDLESELHDATFGLTPGDVLTPVDPNDPDALGKAELRLDEARVMPADLGMDTDSMYATALKLQLDAFKNDPAARQALAQSQVHNLEDFAKRVGTDPQKVSALFEAAQAAGPAELNTLSTEYAQTFGPTRIDLGEVAQACSPEVATALAFAFSKAGNADTASVFAGRAAQMIDQVTGAAKSANDKVAELQSTLEKDLAQYGAAMTPAQREDFEKQYWQKHQPELDAQKSANATLASTLIADQGTLTQLAAVNPEAAKAIAKGLSELARDGDQAGQVKTIVEGMRTKGPDGKMVYPPGFADAEQDLGKAEATACDTLAKKALSEGDAPGAAEQLEQLHTFLENTAWATKDMQEFVSRGLPALENFTKAVKAALKTGDFATLTSYMTSHASELKEAGEIGGDVGKLFGNVTKGIGVAAYLAGIASDKTSGKDKLIDVLKVGKDGAELLADGFEAISDATRQATNRVLQGAGAIAEDLGPVLERAAPVLGLVASVISSGGDIAEAFKDPSVGTIGAAVGDAFTTAGAALALVPGLDVVGGALAFIGTGISLITGWIDEANKEDDRKDEAKALLTSVFENSAKAPPDPLGGLSNQDCANAAARIVNTGADVTQLAKDAGLTPAQLVKLAVATPVMGEPFAAPLNEIAKYSGLKGQAFVDFLTKMGNGTLEEKLITWQTSSIESGAQTSAGEQADWYAQSELNKGNDYATAYERKYQEIFDRQISGLLKAQGLIP